MCVTLLIVDLLQFCVCCMRSGVIRCTLIMTLCLNRMRQCGLHAVSWSHMGILIPRLAAEPRSTAGLLFPPQCPSRTILLTPYSMVWDWLVSRAGLMLFYWPKLLYQYYSLLLFFPFFSFCLLVGIVGLRSSDWHGVYHSLSALQCRPLLIIIIMIIIIIIIIVCDALINYSTPKHLARGGSCWWFEIQLLSLLIGRYVESIMSYAYVQQW